MGVVAKWRAGSRVPAGADAQKCYEEIAEICEDLDSVRAEDVLEKAKDESTELHKCFEWNDGIAAEKYRLIQARDTIRFLVIKEESVPKDRPEVRLFYKTERTEGYKPTQIIVKQEDEYKALLKRARVELEAFKRKYSMLKNELLEVFEAIDQLGIE